MSTNSRITKIQSQLSNIADDIRYLMNTSEPMTLQDMGDKISIMREQEWCKPTSGSGADVTLGQIDADGNFQPLAFDGQTASNSGDPQTAECYYGWNGTLPSPSGGINVTQSGNTTYYKCASVDTANKTWTGYLAVLGEDGVYTFESTATTGLIYGTAFTPIVNKIYNADATVAVSGLYEGSDPNLVFYAPLETEESTARTGQPMTTSGTVTYPSDYADCSNGYLIIEDTSALPFGLCPRTLMCRVRFTGDIYSFNTVIGYGASCGLQGYDNRLVFGTQSASNMGDYIDKNVWYHAAATYDGATVKIYVNGGTPVVRSHSSATGVDGSLQLGFGANYIKDVRIYNRVLSDEEIAAIAAE